QLPPPGTKRWPPPWLKRCPPDGGTPPDRTSPRAAKPAPPPDGATAMPPPRAIPPPPEGATAAPPPPARAPPPPPPRPTSACALADAGSAAASSSAAAPANKVRFMTVLHANEVSTGERLNRCLVRGNRQAGFTKLRQVAARHSARIHLRPSRPPAWTAQALSVTGFSPPAPPSRRRSCASRFAPPAPARAGTA